MHNVLHENYYNIGRMDRCLMQIWSQTKSMGIKLPEVHSVKKTLDTNTLPEKQRITPQIKRNVEIKWRLGQGRAGVKCMKPQITIITYTATDKLQAIPRIPTAQNVAKIVWTFQCMNNQ